MGIMSRRRQANLEHFEKVKAEIEARKPKKEVQHVQEAKQEETKKEDLLEQQERPRAKKGK